MSKSHMRVMKSRAFPVPPTAGLPERTKAYIRAARRPTIVLETCKTLPPTATFYPGIAAGNFLATASGFSEPSWGFFGAVAGHPTEHRGTTLGRAREERGMASAGHWSGAVSASSCDGEALSCCISLVWDLFLHRFGGPGGSSE